MQFRSTEDTATVGSLQGSWQMMPGVILQLEKQSSTSAHHTEAGWPSLFINSSQGSVHPHIQVHLQKIWILWKSSVFFVTQSRKWNSFYTSPTRTEWSFYFFLFRLLLILIFVKQVKDQYWKPLVSHRYQLKHLKIILTLDENKKTGSFKLKCQGSEKYFPFHANNTWLGILLH